MKTVKSKSGLTGWQDKLQNTYANFNEFKQYCSIYGVHKRLGYISMKKAWESNPTIQGSTEPSDLSVVYFHVLKKTTKNSYKISVKESVERECKNVPNSVASFMSRNFAVSHANQYNISLVNKSH
jgi:hypothetical protein